MVIRLHVDPARCKGAGVCLSIAPGHLHVADGAAHPTPGTSVAADAARDAVVCCPNEAITPVFEPDAGSEFSVEAPIATLGPVGTDAHAEAIKHSDHVRLLDSFADAMRLSADGDGGVLAMVAAGYIERDGDKTVDSWSDQHFTHHRRLMLTRLWESRTKPMCIAIHRSVPDMTRVGSVAVHPATTALLELHNVPGRRVFVNAKPLAAAAAARGEVDACIASLDVVAELPELRVIEQVEPTMVWFLYAPRCTP